MWESPPQYSDRCGYKRNKLANSQTGLRVDSEPSRPSFEDALAMAHKQRHKSLAVDWGATEYLLADDKQYASNDEDNYDYDYQHHCCHCYYDEYSIDDYYCSSNCSIVIDMRIMMIIIMIKCYGLPWPLHIS